MKLTQFDGGQSSRLAPHYLQPNQGANYVNIDNSTGTLTPVKDKVDAGIIVKPYHTYYNFGKEWLGSDVVTDYLEFQRKMYWTDRVTPPQKYSDGTQSRLGIVGPEIKPDLVNENLAPAFTGIRSQNVVTGGDLPIADISYMLFNSSAGILSAPRSFVVFASSTTDTRTAEARPPEGTQLHDWSPIIANGIASDPDSPRSVQFDKVVGVFGEDAVLYRWYDGEWRYVGVLDTRESVLVDSVHDISANDKLDESTISPFNGVYQYVYTFYNESDGSESVPSPISDELTATSGSIRVTMPSDPGDPQVTHKRIYRVGGNLTSFAMVAEVVVATYVYSDRLTESDMDSRQLESENYYEAPDTLSFLSESYAMLFGAVESTLRFTPIGKPNAWPPEYSIQFDDDITGIGPVANGLLVFTRTKTYIVTGTGPMSLAQQSLRGDQGCIAHESIQQAERGTLLWASEDGLCTSSGNDVKSITKYLLGDIALTPVDSAVHNEVYYVLNSDDTVLAYDYRYGSMFKWLELGVKSLTVAEAKLYGVSFSLLHELFESDVSLPFSYTSPRLTDSSMSYRKTYKKVYVRSEGDIIINIIIDDDIVATVSLDSKDTHQLQIPQQDQSGYYIQFSVSGTGTVYEIEYRVGARNNE